MVEIQITRSPMVLTLKRPKNYVSPLSTFLSVATF